MQDAESPLARNTQMAKQKLAQDLGSTMDDVEELLRLTAGQVGERMAEVRLRLQSSLEQSRSHLADLQSSLIDSGKQATQDVDEYVRANPWQALGIAAVACVVIGALISRR